jgi:hypothetical protein
MIGQTSRLFTFSLFMTQAPPVGAETGQQRFERILSQTSFAGLKAILARLSPDRERLYAGVKNATDFEDVLARLGYKIILTEQIHVQDCYSRLYPEGDIKAVLPYFDIPTYAALPTLINLDSTVTTTPPAATFFTGLLGELRKQLSAPA